MVGWGFGVGVLDWVFGVRRFSWWGFGPVVWGRLGSLGFWGLGSLYKNRRINLEKKLCITTLYIVWGLSWYWLELSALKISIFANANIKFLEESFQSNNHTYTGERYLNLDLFICYHNSWLSPWAEVLMIHAVKNLGDNSIKILGLALTTIYQKLELKETGCELP